MSTVPGAIMWFIQIFSLGGAYIMIVHRHSDKHSGQLKIEGEKLLFLLWAYQSTFFVIYWSVFRWLLGN